MRIRRSILAAVIAVGTLAAIATLSVGTIPPRSATWNTMHVLKTSILEFSRSHDRLPSTLGELPATQSGKPKLVDAWNTPIEYRVDEQSIVQLVSLGSDRKGGGDGDARDIVGTFSGVRETSGFSPTINPWIKEPSD